MNSNKTKDILQKIKEDKRERRGGQKLWERDIFSYIDNDWVLELNKQNIIDYYEDLKNG